MTFFYILLSWISGLVLLAASFVYLVDSKRGQQILQRFLQQLRLPLLILLTVYVASALVRAADSVSMLVGFLILSVAAYFFREHGRPHREKRLNLGGSERTPVVPITTRRANGDDVGGGR